MNLRYGFLFVAIQLYQKRGFHAIFLLENIEISRCKSTFTSAKFEFIKKNGDQRVLYN